MIEFINKLKNYRLSTDLEFSILRKAQIANLLFPITAFFAVVLMVSLALVGKGVASILNTGLIAGLLLLSTVFNWRGKFFFAKNFFLFVIAIGICSSSFFAGKTFPAELINIPAVGIPFLLFPRKDKKVILIWCLIFTLNYFFLRYLYTVITPIDPLGVEDQGVMKSVLIVVMFFWMISVFFVISGENRLNEELIKEGVENEKNLQGSLKENHKKLLNSQEALIDKEREKIKAIEGQATALRKAEIKTKFLVKMSHELRSPLNGIIGNIELWKRKGELKGSDFEFLKRISNSSQLLLGIINDVLDLSKIEEGKMDLHPSIVSFKKIINNSVSLYKNLGQEKGLEILCDVDDRIPDYISVDSLRLAQVINNLLSNAMKFSYEGNVKIEAVKVKEGIIKIEVQDTGVGITEEAQQNLFQEYNQIKNSFESNGSGLGLAICKSLTELMGGEIGVESNPGNGSTFWFTIQYNDVSPEEVAEDLIEVSEVQLNLNVLLVDDMEINLSLAKAMLEEYGCNVETADCGKLALEKYKIEKYDLVLMDINMPDINGDVVVKELKSKYKCDSVFIGLSANAMEGEKEKYLQMGLDDYISKPVTFDKLLNCLQSWFKTQAKVVKPIAQSVESDSFLIDEAKVVENVKLMGGWVVFSKFIDKFLIQNQEIIEVIKNSHQKNETDLLSLELHKLSGIATSMGAVGYYEILHEAHISIKCGNILSVEELNIILGASEEIDKDFKKIKLEWQDKKDY